MFSCELKMHGDLKKIFPYCLVRMIDICTLSDHTRSTCLRDVAAVHVGGDERDNLLAVDGRQLAADLRRAIHAIENTSEKGDRRVRKQHSRQKSKKE